MVTSYVFVLHPRTPSCLFMLTLNENFDVPTIEIVSNIYFSFNRYRTGPDIVLYPTLPGAWYRTVRNLLTVSFQHRSDRTTESTRWNNGIPGKIPDRMMVKSTGLNHDFKSTGYNHRIMYWMESRLLSPTGLKTSAVFLCVLTWNAAKPRRAAFMKDRMMPKATVS